MATKQHHTSSIDNDAYTECAPFDDAGHVRPLVRINNMRQVEPGLFEFTGVKPRNVDWMAVAIALGFEDTMPDVLTDELGQAIFRHDIREFLVANLVG